MKATKRKIIRLIDLKNLLVFTIKIMIAKNLKIYHYEKFHFYHNRIIRFME